MATPVDILPFEKAGFFRGRYFVLGGLLSPLDGVRAEDLPFDRLVAPDRRRTASARSSSPWTPAWRGRPPPCTSSGCCRTADLRLTRLATGIPVGGALAYTDEVTLQRAFQFRRGF